MIESAFPVNEVNPLVEIPSNIPLMGFLGGGQGNEINEAIKKDYKGFYALQIAKYSDSVIKSSNPFYVVAVQNRLPSGVDVATQADLEKALRCGSMDFRGTYEDTELVLRTNDDPNSYLADNLMNQVKQRGKKKMPIMIPLRGLELEKDTNSPYGLTFKLKENAELIYSPTLNKDNGYFLSTDINEKTGLPKKLGKGERYLYTRNKGLSRLYLNRSLNLYSRNDDLAISNAVGRVVLVSTAEGGSRSFLEDRMEELQTQRDSQINEINKRYNRAKAILKGEKK
ncbi:MAG: hypothetical protein ABIB79_00950 [archaeon]